MVSDERDIDSASPASYHLDLGTPLDRKAITHL